MISVVKWATVKEHNSCASIHVINGSNSGDLCSEAVASKSGHCYFFLVHEPSDILAHLEEPKGIVVIRVSEVPVVQEPNVPVI